MPASPCLWTMAVIAIALATTGALVASDPSPAAAVRHDHHATATSATGRALYVGHRDSGFVSVFSIGPDGRLSSPVHVPSGDGPIAIALAPDARAAYVANAFESTITVFAVDDDGGLRQVLQRVTRHVAGPSGIAVAPDGATVYVANQDDSTVAGFVVADDGRLAPLGEPVPSGADLPRDVAMTADGRSLFVSHWSPDGGGPSTLASFSIRLDGRLRPRDRVATGVDGGGLAISPDGRFLYETAQTSGEIFGFSVGRRGGLRSALGSPFDAGTETQAIAMSPDGRHLFVTNVTRPGLVWSFAVGARGALTPVTGSPVRAGREPTGLAVTPDGRSLYVSNSGSNDVSAFGVDEGGGLVPIDAPVPTGGDAPAAFRGTVVLPDQGPVAAFSITARPSGQPSGFDASSSIDPDGVVVRFDWDFGDGTVLQDGGSDPFHVFDRPGAYEVSLTVTDDEGCSTDLVFTGQTALCNGSSAARVMRVVVVAQEADAARR